MGLQNPSVAYIAASNHEAHVVTSLLNGIGIEAYVAEDNVAIGEGSLFGSTNHRPRVFIEKADAGRAAKLLADFMKQQQQESQQRIQSPPIRSECEDCGAKSEFPGGQDGTVQNCPKCNALMDVGTFAWPEEYE